MEEKKIEFRKYRPLPVRTYGDFIGTDDMEELPADAIIQLFLQIAMEKENGDININR